MTWFLWTRSREKLRPNGAWPRFPRIGNRSDSPARDSKPPDLATSLTKKDITYEGDNSLKNIHYPALLRTLGPALVPRFRPRPYFVERRPDMASAPRGVLRLEQQHVNVRQFRRCGVDQRPHFCQSSPPSPDPRGGTAIDRTGEPANVFHKSLQPRSDVLHVRAIEVTCHDATALRRFRSCFVLTKRHWPRVRDFHCHCVASMMANRGLWKTGVSTPNGLHLDSVAGVRYGGWL